MKQKLLPILLLVLSTVTMADNNQSALDKLKTDTVWTEAEHAQFYAAIISKTTNSPLPMRADGEYKNIFKALINPHILDFFDDSTLTLPEVLAKGAALSLQSSQILIAYGREHNQKKADYESELAHLMAFMVALTGKNAKALDDHIKTIDIDKLATNQKQGFTMAKRGTAMVVDGIITSMSDAIYKDESKVVMAKALHDNIENLTRFYDDDATVKVAANIEQLNQKITVKPAQRLLRETTEKLKKK